jgi:hypothetical protein
MLAQVMLCAKLLLSCDSCHTFHDSLSWFPLDCKDHSRNAAGAQGGRRDCCLEGVVVSLLDWTSVLPSANSQIFFLGGSGIACEHSVFDMQKSSFG